MGHYEIILWALEKGLINKFILNRVLKDDLRKYLWIDSEVVDRHRRKAFFNTLYTQRELTVVTTG